MTTASATTNTGMNRARVGVQRFGTFLSGMIMPNIAAFIAWGFITMLFIPAGFFGANSPFGWHWAPVAEIIGERPLFIADGRIAGAALFLRGVAMLEGRAKVGRGQIGPTARAIKYARTALA